MSRKLYRSSTNKVLGGVCGGIGEYFNIDPVLVRLLMIVFTLMGGSGFVIYLIAYVIIPAESTSINTMDGTNRSGGNRLLRGVLLLVILIMGFALMAMLWGVFRWSLGLVFHSLNF